jgi:hypothetical protein
MNRRPHVTAAYAEGDMERYMRAIGAAGTLVRRIDGHYTLTLRKDVATRETALHEWLHYARTRREVGLLEVAAEERWIDAFLARHRRLLRLDE